MRARRRDEQFRAGAWRGARAGGAGGPVHGRQVCDAEGKRIGRIGQVYLDDASQQPSWVSVDTGHVATAETYVPLHGARLDGNELRLAVTSDGVSSAPVVRADQGRLSQESRQSLADHYGIAAAATWDGSEDVRPSPDESVERGGELSFGTGIGGTQTGRAGLASSAGTGSLRERGIDDAPGDDDPAYFAVGESGEHRAIHLDEFGSPVVDEAHR